MTAFRDLSDDRAIALAAEALSRAFGCLASVTLVRRLSRDDRRNLVLRALARIDGTERPVIVKASRAAGHDGHAADALGRQGLVREWTARALLAHAEGHVGRSPHLLAGDAGNGIIVFEDHGEGLESLVRPLLHGTAAEAEAALTAYAESVAALHAHTAAAASGYAAVVRADFPLARIGGMVGADWHAHPRPYIDGVAPWPEDELAAVHARLADPGPWLALVHGDGCPDNVLLADAGAVLIDFEFAGPGHALLDAVYWRMGFPSCWCAGAVPEPAAGRIEAAYRREVARAIPPAGDDSAFPGELAVAMVGRLVNSLIWLLPDALREDGTWGIATRRSRILHHLQAVAAACDQADRFPGMRDACRAWRAALGARWSGTQPLALYPAFRIGSSSTVSV